MKLSGTFCYALVWFGWVSADGILSVHPKYWNRYSKKIFYQVYIRSSYAQWAAPSWTLNYNPKQNGSHGVPHQGGKQARFSLLTYSSKEPETHEAQPFVLQSHVMQCRRFSWQVTRLQSLVKALSRFAACSGTVSAERDLQTRWRTCCKVHVCFPQRARCWSHWPDTSHANETDWWIKLTLRCCQLDHLAPPYKKGQSLQLSQRFGTALTSASDVKISAFCAISKHSTWPRDCMRMNWPHKTFCLNFVIEAIHYCSQHRKVKGRVILKSGIFWRTFPSLVNVPFVCTVLTWNGQMLWSTCDL